MKIVLNRQASSKRKKSRLQARFEKLRSQLEQKRRQNLHFRSDLDDLVEVFRSHSLEMDSAQIEVLKSIAAKLVDFTARKSLSDWHRSELLDWLKELSSRIEPIDPGYTETLRESYQDAIASAMGLTKEQLEAAHQAEQEEFEATFFEEDDGDEPFFEENAEDEPVQEDLFGFDDGDFTAHDPGDHEAPYEQLFDEEDYLSAGDRLKDESWIKKLFRRAAQALHPDREPDEQKRQYKQKKMSELLEARKSGDIMTILAIYSEHVDDSEIAVADQEMSLLCELLEEQIDEIEMEKNEYIFSSPYHAMVYDILYAPTRAARKRNVEQWKADARNDIATNDKILLRLRNLTELKEELKLRRQQRHSIEEMFFGLD